MVTTEVETWWPTVCLAPLTYFLLPGQFGFVDLLYHNTPHQWGFMAHYWNPSAWEAERGVWFWHQPGLYSYIVRPCLKKKLKPQSPKSSSHIELGVPLYTFFPAQEFSSPSSTSLTLQSNWVTGYGASYSHSTERSLGTSTLLRTHQRSFLQCILNTVSITVPNCIDSLAAKSQG
jgi:hypothetical protein